MKTVLMLVVHGLTTIARLLGAGSVKTLVAENLLLKQQLLILNRSRQRSPNLSPVDRCLLGLWSLFLGPRRLVRAAITVRPSTLLNFHACLVRGKYRALFSPKSRAKPGPKGPSEEVIQAIIELKRRNPRFGCPRIALTISSVFGVDIDKDVVRRVLAKYYRPHPSGDDGPSWLTFIGHMKDSLWSVDLFRCESIVLKTHWVLVVMDQFTRRIIGFAFHKGELDGPTICRMLNESISGHGMPKYLSSDNHPLFEYHRWKANLRVMGVEEIKTVPYAPLSHPFVERLIGTVRREYLNNILFWTVNDLERKLDDFKIYYNKHRQHRSLGGRTPSEFSGEQSIRRAKLTNFGWVSSCNGLFLTPIAAQPRIRHQHLRSPLSAVDIVQEARFCRSPSCER